MSQVVLVQEQLSRVWPVALLPHAEMKNARRQNSVQHRREQVCDTEKDDVIFNIQGTAGAHPSGLGRNPKIDRRIVWYFAAVS